MEREIGPVEYMIVSFPGNQFTGEIAPALAKLVESNTIRIIDLAFVGKSADGEVWELVAKAEMPTKTHWIRATTQGNGLILVSGDFGPVIAFDPATEKAPFCLSCSCP